MGLSRWLHQPIASVLQEKNLVIGVPRGHSGWTMKVEFYGHVRQYRNLQKEIDGNLQQVLLSGQYVMGPMLKRFEEELASMGPMTYWPLKSTDRKSTRLNSSHSQISYAVFCLKKKKKK